jgi:hypothetical protein
VLHQGVEEPGHRPGTQEASRQPGREGGRSLAWHRGWSPAGAWRRRLNWAAPTSKSWLGLRSGRRLHMGKRSRGSDDRSVSLSGRRAEGARRWKIG